MDYPTEPLDQPARQSGDSDSGTTDQPPAGYFTTPSPAPAAKAADDPETQGQRETSAVTRAVRHPARVGTIVWGAVVLVAGVLLILSSQLDLNLDPGLTTMWLLLGAGIAMVAGGAVNLLHKRQY